MDAAPTPGGDGSGAPTSATRAANRESRVRGEATDLGVASQVLLPRQVRLSSNRTLSAWRTVGRGIGVVTGAVETGGAGAGGVVPRVQTCPGLPMQFHSCSGVPFAMF